MDAHLLELVKHPTDTVVDRQDRFAIAAVQVVESFVAVIAEVDSVPTIALVTHPARCIVRGGDTLRRVAGNSSRLPRIDPRAARRA